MSLSSEIQNDMREIEGDLENPTFDWNGASVPCIPSAEQRGLEYEIGGRLVPVALTLLVRKQLFLTADSTLHTVDGDLHTVDSDIPVPVAGRKIQFRGRDYEVVTARESTIQSHYELTLADPNNVK